MTNGTDLVPRMIDGEVISQRVTDGYVNATAMCRAAGKLFGHYHANKQTDEFLLALERSIGIPIDLLITRVAAGPNEFRGTWVHPKVAIHLAQWLSPRFAVQVAEWVYEWMIEGAPRTKPELPFHLRRYMANYPNVPPGHFSVLTEVTLMLIAPLELHGYTLPERLWPDISEGQIYARWLREEKGLDLKDMPTYRHGFEDGRRSVPARAFPNGLLPSFRHHFETVWLPLRAMNYFRPRDPVALEYLPKLLTGPDSKAA